MLIQTSFHHCPFYHPRATRAIKVLKVVQEMEPDPAVGNEEHNATEYDGQMEATNVDQQDPMFNVNAQETEVNLYSLPPLPLERQERLLYVKHVQ